MGWGGGGGGEKLGIKLKLSFSWGLGLGLAELGKISMQKSVVMIPVHVKSVNLMSVGRLKSVCGGYMHKEGLLIPVSPEVKYQPIAIREG